MDQKILVPRCNQYLLGYKTLSQCKSQCNCNNSPNKFSSHSKYRQCSKIYASTNYLPCRHNFCSGGNCCTRSANICKTACKAYHAIKFGGEIITYKNIDIPVYKYIYENKTQYINITNNINITRYYDIVRNVTRYNNVTNQIIKQIIKYINKTRYQDIPREIIKYINKTRYNNLTKEIIKYINKTRYQNIPKEIIKYINKTRYNNLTKEIIKYINKTRYIDNIIDKINWINKTRYIDNIIDKINWINKTNYTELIIEIPIKKNITIYKNITVYKNITNCIKNKNNTIPPSVFHNIDDNYDINILSNNTCNCETKENKISFWMQIGFFITLGLSIFFALICIWRCWLKEILEDFIDDLLCCGYGSHIKNCLTCCCILCESDNNKEKKKEDNNLEKDIQLSKIDIENNIKLDNHSVLTPNGTIRRRYLI